jgi:hypothetical protein
MTLRHKVWSPYVAGVLIGLLQIPAFLVIETALGTSSSYVTIAAHIAALFDASTTKLDYLARHMYGAKNLWQVAMVIGIALGAFLSMRASGAARRFHRFGEGPSGSRACRRARPWRSLAASSWFWAHASRTGAPQATASLVSRSSLSARLLRLELCSLAPWPRRS